MKKNRMITPMLIFAITLGLAFDVLASNKDTNETSYEHFDLKMYDISTPTFTNQ